jgi:hypothetical protein
MDEQEQFIHDLEQFITNHKHFKSNEGTQDNKVLLDQHIFDIHDPNGDYERINIIINKVP